MNRIAIVATLKPDRYERAQDLLRQGPPFDLDAKIFERHAVYLSNHEVVLVFEGRDVERGIDDLTSDFLQQKMNQTLSDWRDLIDGHPRIAREAFFWDQPETIGAGRWRMAAGSSACRRRRLSAWLRTV